MVASPRQPPSPGTTPPSAAKSAGRGSIVAVRDPSGIVTLEIVAGSRSQNVIDARFLGDLRQSLDELEAGPAPRAVLLCSGRPGSFFAGADIDRLETILGADSAAIEQACSAGRQLYARLSSNSWPTVAVIDGVCLGGGLEIALACDYRVATSAEGTLLGFPEVKLGLLPGWGGTVWLPRLIGPGPAVEMIAAGETMSGAAAARLGLVDACVPAEKALAAARLLVDSATATGVHLEQRRRRSLPIELAPEEREFLEATTGAVIQGRTAGHYPAPPAILEAVLATSLLPALEAGAIEGKAFASLARSPVARQLVRVFRLGEKNRRDRGIEADRVTPDAASPDADERAFERPAVVGAGIMGAGIAAAHLRAAFRSIRVLGFHIRRASIPSHAAIPRSSHRTRHICHSTHDLPPAAFRLARS